MSRLLLQDAVILGETLKKCDPNQWLSEDGSCGCAFGGALLAAGVTAKEYFAQIAISAHLTERPMVRERWPWLQESHLIHISHLYSLVAGGERTIEDVAAYVRTIEPAQEQMSEPIEDEISGDEHYVVQQVR